MLYGGFVFFVLAKKATGVAFFTQRFFLLRKTIPR